MTRVWTVATVVLICALVWFSCWLARTRIYQADECQNVYVAQLLSSGRAETSFTAVTLYLAPLAWIGRGVSSSVELFSTARYFALAVFWLNVVLLAVATGERLSSPWRLAALIGAATLAPLWDYGFEIRHDNVLLTGLLMMWCALRVFPQGVPSYVAAGALAVLLEFVAFKAFLYALPLSVASLIWPAPAHRTSPTISTIAWLTAALVTFLVICAGYGVAGWWDFYLRDFRGVSETAAQAARFGPFAALARLCLQTPLLLVAMPASVIWLKEGARRHGVPVLTWSGLLPETLLFSLALIALAANPSPYPYNLVNVVPFGFLLAFRALSTLSSRFVTRADALIAVWLIVGAAHLIPFVFATARHIDMKNDRQRTLMRMAEDLTDPAADAVYDGIGMVPTRRSVNFNWLLHSLYVNRFRPGGDLRVRGMLAATPAAVIIPSYRTDWLPPADHEFIRSRYLAFSDDLWLLGGVLAPGGGNANVVRGGRYRIVTLQSGTNVPISVQDALRKNRSILGLQPHQRTVVVDGKVVTEPVVRLAVGAHEITCRPDCSPGFVWLGPRLTDLPLIGERDHRALFVNWY